MRTSPRCLSMFWVYLVMVSSWSCRGTRPLELGPIQDQLRGCPPKPNCVSSQTSDAEHKIATLPLLADRETSISKLKQIIVSMPRTRIISERSDYLYVEYESLIFRFVDDLELYAPEGAGAIQVRSASRLGHSDLGVNRQRVEAIRSNYLKK